jgi:hypothetical protein
MNNNYVKDFDDAIVKKVAEASKVSVEIVNEHHDTLLKMRDELRSLYKHAKDPNSVDITREYAAVLASKLYDIHKEHIQLLYRISVE